VKNFAKIKNKEKKMHDKNEKEVEFEEERLLNLDVDHDHKTVYEKAVEAKDEVLHEEGLLEELVEQVEEEEVKEEAEVLLEETTEMVDTAEVEATEENVPAPPKETKNAKALRLVEQARSIVQEADAQTEECKLLLMDDLKEYEEAKSKLKKSGFDDCESLLEKLGYQTTSEEQEEEESVVFEPKEEMAPMDIKGVSGGKFSGFVLALLGGAATAVGLVYLATEKLGMTLNVSKLPSSEETQNILSSFPTMVGLQPDATIGAGLLGVSVLLVMFLIYKIRVGLKANRNLHFAVKQFVEAELYTEQKSNCKIEMEKVDVHMKETVETMNVYEILLHEQEGKLQRILYFEGEKGKSTEYHEKSYAEIRETKELMRTIKGFMAIPMSEDGKLSENSVERLLKAKSQMDKMIDRLY